MATADRANRGKQDHSSWILLAPPFAGWWLFCLGYFWRERATEPHRYLEGLTLALVPVALAISVGIILRKRKDWRDHIAGELERHTDAIDAIPDSRIGLWIALAAGLGLYGELMIIRLHASFFQLFAYFKNISLLSCFLGLGIGYAMGPRRPLTTPLFLPFLGLQIAFMHFLRFETIAPYLQNPISEQLTFGMAQAERTSHVAAVFGFLILIFSVNAYCFVPLGHLVSRLMLRRHRLTSYSWNLVGSLLGIAVFSLISFAWAPPPLWILALSLMVVPFLRNTPRSLSAAAVVSTLLIAFLSISFRFNQFEVHSPYQVLTFTFQRDSPPVVQVNHVYYQRILNLSKENVDRNEPLKKWAEHYELPYDMKPKPNDVLIVGSGSGNDVAAALRRGARNIQAVEIDPAILEFGKLFHPEAPYQAKEVQVTVNDARTFIRHTGTEYDLIVYGLLDSHTLLSGLSGVRLDSYVYTVEAFREARARLKEGGILSISFSLITTELGRKLFLMLQEAFDGQSPMVYQTAYDGSYTFVIGDRVLAQGSKLPDHVRDVTASYSDSRVHADKSTDDWPFFYMPVRKYPLTYFAVILVLLYLSWFLIRHLASGSGGAVSFPCFFLGAGFMLVETKAITELALVYGSTWIVTSAVIAGVILMAFLANLLIIRVGTPPRVLAYGVLIGSVLAGLYAGWANLSSLTPWVSRTIMTAMLTLPLFFAGLAFSAELRKSASVAVALYSNLTGAMLGGFLEYNSMHFGIRSLYFLALGMYGLAFLASSRTRQTVEVGDTIGAIAEPLN